MFFQNHRNESFCFAYKSCLFLVFFLSACGSSSTQIPSSILTNADINLPWLTPAGSLSISGTISIPAGVPAGDTLFLYVKDSLRNNDFASGGTSATGTYVTATGTVQTLSFEISNLPASSYWICAGLENSSLTVDDSGCYNGTTTSPIQTSASSMAVAVSSTSLTGISFGLAAGLLSTN